MIKLVNELKALMTETGLSPERASHFVDCSYNSIIRWLKNMNPPSPMYQRKIREGIVKIKMAYPDVKSSFDLAIEGRTLYRKIKGKITFKEKQELFDINLSEGQDRYFIRLKELDLKYGKD